MLLYTLVLVLIAAVLFGLVSLLFGRSEQLPPLPAATTATMLPAVQVTGRDVDEVKFTQVLRGYKTSEVDWVLDRLGQELDLLRGQLAAVQADPATVRGAHAHAHAHADDHAHAHAADHAHGDPDGHGPADPVRHRAAP